MIRPNLHVEVWRGAHLGSGSRWIMTMESLIPSKSQCLNSLMIDDGIALSGSLQVQALKFNTSRVRWSEDSAG